MQALKLNFENKKEYLEFLNTSPLELLWNTLLDLQTQLYFPFDLEFLKKTTAWNTATKIIDIGSGNGAYLAKLWGMFPEKEYLGFEKDPGYLEKSALFQKANLTFSKGDAEDYEEEYCNRFDLVLFRLVLQHLKNPLRALLNASKYIKQSGHILIMEACDIATQSSHSFPQMLNALAEVGSAENIKSRNRQVTMQLLNCLNNEENPLSHLFEVVYTNLDTQHQFLDQFVYLSTKEEKALQLHCSMIMFTIFRNQYDVQVNLSNVYDELYRFVLDKDSWFKSGMHYLILSKKSFDELTL